MIDFISFMFFTMGPCINYFDIFSNYFLILNISIQIFSMNFGDRVGMPNFLIIVTDGNSNIDDQLTVPESIYARIKVSFITRFVLNQKWYFTTKLSCIHLKVNAG